jgi:hypothetical protein
MENSKLHYTQIINAKLSGFCMCLLIASLALNIAQYKGFIVNKDALTIIVPKQQQVASVQPVYLEDGDALMQAVENRTR